MNDRREHLRHIIEHTGHLLPTQGPIGVFIHHNTLHAFQHLPFEEAVVQASSLFGTEAYLSEERFRHALGRGRIEVQDIDFVLSREANRTIVPGVLDRRSLLKTLLVSGVRQFNESTIRWEMEDGELHDLLSSNPGARALFQAIDERIGIPQAKAPTPPVRPRDGFLIFGVDLDDTVHPILIRLCAAYLDQGLAYWPMPLREKGFLASVHRLWSTSGAIDAEKLDGLADEFRRQAAADLDAESVILEMLDRFGIEESEWENVILAELRAMPGWPGMIRCLEKEPHLAEHHRVPFSLIEFVAVRLTLTAVAAKAANPTHRTLASVWRNQSISSSRPETERSVEVARLFDAAQKTNLAADLIRKLSSAEFETFRHEVRLADPLERQRLFQLAYEYWHERKILGPILRYRQTTEPYIFKTRPTAQVMCCLDEREESFRRLLEEIAPEIETFGAAGFYGVAVNYTGIDDGSGAPLCPVVVTPKHAIRELPIEDDHSLHHVRKLRRKLLAKMSRNLFFSSRTLFRGWLSTVWLGVWSLFPLAARILAPREYGILREKLNRAFLPEPRTELTLMRMDAAGHNIAEGLLLGFSTVEKIDRVASVLVPAGMRRNFARIVVILGHGSTSLNNPFESAYNCGACGGRSGGPNGRLFAAMANRPDVRKGLLERGVEIPDDTWFIGGVHDTCSDDIELFDLDLVPVSHVPDLVQVRLSLDQARAANAHERSRRFEAADQESDFETALRHVEERAEHIAEPRPEYGHGTNAITYIGRRGTVRGLFFDRRVFLTSYDPIQDQNDDQLTAVLAAAGPVCAGISLEYYFSCVDNEGYGCGTKLPHNVTSLIGVMNGHSSDLRTGLPIQTVEIHEPVRSLFVIETTPERLKGVLARLPGVTELVHNRWIRVATLDPDTGAMHVYRNGVFERMEDNQTAIPTTPSSLKWYQGQIDHLPVARIEKGLVSA